MHLFRLFGCNLFSNSDIFKEYGLDVLWNIPQVGFGIEDQRGSLFSSNHIKGIYCQHDLSLALTLITWEREFLLSFCCVKLLFFPFPHCTPQRKSLFTMYSPQVRSRKLCSPSLRTEYLHKFFEIFLHEMFYTLIYLFNHSFILYEHMYVNSVFWIISLYNFILLLKLLYLWPLWALSIDFYISLSCTHYWNSFWSTFLHSVTTRCFRFILEISCPVLYV